MVQRSVHQPDKAIRHARDIAYSNLCQCMTPIGVIAGTHHFVDMWARDSLFAVFGLYSKADLTVTKNTINTFLTYQRKDGLVPYRIMRSRTSVGKYFGKPSYLNKPKPEFRSRQSGGIVPDGGLLVVIAAAEYFRRTNDLAFLQEIYPALARSMQWYRTRYHSGLIREWFQCEWADGVLKIGNVLYTNVLYVKSLGDLACMLQALNRKIEAEELTVRKSRMQRLCMETFWNGTYLSDWVDYTRHDYFASHANFLAIMFDIVNRKQADLILQKARDSVLADFTVETNHPGYPIWRVPVLQLMTGMGDYHNRGCLWLQPGITFALALWKTGNTKESLNWLTRIAQHIIRFGGVYEVYDRNGIPVRRRLYRAEGPFAWSAGLFIYACEVFGTGRATHTSRRLQ